jgi:Helitron helicase-like domain at N-terminus
LCLGLFQVIIRRFQGHSAFVVSSFDISRLSHNLSKTNVLAQRKNWPATELLLASLTAEQLLQAASQAQKHQPITDPAVQELLKGVARVGSTASGSDERKSYMLAQLKSLIVHFGCPLIFITINPHERYTPLALFYAGEEINICKFEPKLYSLAQRLKTTLANPLAIVEYFHLNLITAIIKNILKEGMFGEIAHYYGTIEYQGRGTPHTHLAVHGLGLFTLTIV